MSLGGAAAKQLGEGRRVSGTSCVLGSNFFTVKCLLVTEAQEPLTGTAVQSLGQGDRMAGLEDSSEIGRSTVERRLESCEAGKKRSGAAL